MENVVATPKVVTQPMLLPLAELTIMPTMPATQTMAEPPRNQLMGMMGHAARADPTGARRLVAVRP